MVILLKTSFILFFREKLEISCESVLTVHALFYRIFEKKKFFLLTDG